VAIDFSRRACADDAGRGVIAGCHVVAGSRLRRRGAHGHVERKTAVAADFVNQIRRRACGGGRGAREAGGVGPDDVVTRIASCPRVTDAKPISRNQTLAQ
jgi:hypothetical protein